MKIFATTPVSLLPISRVGGALTAVGMLIFASSCTKNNLLPNADTPSIQSVITQPDAIKSYLSTLPNSSSLTRMLPSDMPNNGIPILVPDDEIRIRSVASEREAGFNEKGESGWWIKTSRKYKISEVFDESILLNPTSDILYPGAVLAGSSIADGTYAAISKVDVGKVRISIDRRTVDSKDDAQITKEFENIRMSNYRKALNDWSKIQFKEGNVVTVHSVDVVRSTEEAQFKMGATFENPSVKVSTNLKFDFEKKKNHYLVKFIQKQYSVTMDIPRSDYMLFKSVDPKVIKDYQPVYVSNIDYGRMVFMSIDTNHSRSEIESALKVAVEKLNINADIEAKYKKVLDESSINFIAVGGGVEEHAQIVDKGWEGCRAFMIKKIPLEKLPPISFQLRYASDNSLARVVKNSEYVITQKDFIPDCRGIVVTSNIQSFQGFSWHGSEIWVYGKARIETSDKLKVEEGRYVFDLPRPSYLSIINNIHIPFPNGDQNAVTIEIYKPENMDMESFLRERISFTTDLVMAQNNERNDIHLGKGKKEITVADLLKQSGELNDKPMTFPIQSRNHGNLLQANFMVTKTNLIPLKIRK